MMDQWKLWSLEGVWRGASPPDVAYLCDAVRIVNGPEWNICRIYRASYDLCLNLERAVHRFSRYH